MKVTIYHNPDCGTSRNTLAIIRHFGIEPEVIEYLENPPSLQKLEALIADAGISVREAIRKNGTPYQQLGLDNPEVSDEQLLNAMMIEPILINRPFVVAPMGVRLCRPSEAVLDILPPPPKASFAKEDGELVINEEGQRVTQSN
ncbi:arsenate reductase (glutaredoxin) [Herminiimonas arsenitoxidans]|uniref:arsenate reductase (glutaredoxin) n=1 Tax=Herminiimonas arsenitoxidans TaxID=1809410 RepID=UPI0012FF7694|nr:arsenate reductase (glutaredoxin) [Herminiimonas arsenitoxidans]